METLYLAVTIQGACEEARRSQWIWPHPKEASLSCRKLLGHMWQVLMRIRRKVYLPSCASCSHFFDAILLFDCSSCRLKLPVTFGLHRCYRPWIACHLFAVHSHSRLTGHTIQTDMAMSAGLFLLGLGVKKGIIHGVACSHRPEEGDFRSSHHRLLERRG